MYMRVGVVALQRIVRYVVQRFLNRLFGFVGALFILFAIEKPAHRFNQIRHHADHAIGVVGL